MSADTKEFLKVLGVAVLTFALGIGAAFLVCEAIDRHLPCDDKAIPSYAKEAEACKRGSRLEFEPMGEGDFMAVCRCPR